MIDGISTRELYDIHEDLTPDRAYCILLCVIENDIIGAQKANPAYQADKTKSESSNEIDRLLIEFAKEVFPDSQRNAAVQIELAYSRYLRHQWPEDRRQKFSPHRCDPILSYCFHLKNLGWKPIGWEAIRKILRKNTDG